MTTETTRPPIPEGFVMPDFGDRPTPSSQTKGETVAGGPAYSGPRKMAFICSKGNLDMAYPALIMANAALGEGIETHIFFTFWGFDLVTERTMDDLKFTMVGNTAMHLPQAPGMSMPQVMGLLPGMTGMATKMMKKQMDDLDIPGVREFLDIIVASGGTCGAAS